MLRKGLQLAFTKSNKRIPHVHTADCPCAMMADKAFYLRGWDNIMKFSEENKEQLFKVLYEDYN
jgi:hypothetical protein